MLRSTIGAVMRSSKLETSGLVFYLDSRNSLSYSGSGATWNDLSPSGLTTTLYNTPTYTDGILNFSSASFEYAQTNTSAPDYNKWTVECWVKFYSNMSGKITSVITNEFNGFSKLNFSIGTNRAPGSYNVCVGFFDGLWRNTDGFVPSTNVWYHIAGTYDGSVIRQYVNGVANGGTLNYVGTPQSGGAYRIARRWDSVNNDPNNFANADVPVVRVYSKALGSSDIASNYNSEKSYFGL